MTVQNRTMPASTVIPELVYDDVPEAIGWLCDVFGLVERWRAGDHRAQLSFGQGTVAITEPRTSRALPAPQSLMLRVEDAEAHHTRARDRGAKVVAEPADFPYGERQYTAEDIGGHQWTFSQSIADVDPEDWGGTSGAALRGGSTGTGRLVARGPQLSVMLIVPDGRAAVAWYQHALGATTLWDLGDVAGLELEGAPFFIHETNLRNPSETAPSDAGVTSTRIEIFVDDPDAVIDRARATGARAASEPTEHRMPWGTHRQGGFRDPFGHNWSVGDFSPLRAFPE